ncbi:undecaprenyldiphospho-muramoylpentapeptide beta-N-acetylglucosaminyltransferase [Alkalicoccobacillus murimartini]|uniref:UDP-N-acetylglucosamine--N-acetylmuramyl-(pentapeptide) pyrophosphoryl-undecaprenol N-acetylglucosamine transferase n=1 Tax=Alkalicoccobacillus murimartini TaxID=171685 RepID=A0ABT9YMU1_9BACI|nr:undecaprenyldiphospho-muramoylpentapeptide beta-N-acetylglucosaminyltransferase [Alkalicoccobacillus murimartini]MDQ0209193.1 UDP-N-acetylglucosamine--N-acetylmuramyl-(pentapeptide) pyrophosphoryl-undecaprenol N-acetylglucosamine transferase [Alkalicoccobacillus murimartini]
MKKIVFTGGGSAGHVTPNIAIMDQLDQTEWDISYIGSHNGIEKELIGRTSIPYEAISSGKLRRYIDLQNATDAFRVMKGIFDARKVLKKHKPDLVFSKGGFVTVPVVIAASSLKIPVFLHESDLTPGLANKLAQRFTTKIFTSFDEAAAHFPSSKTKAIGSPIRKELFEGNAKQGLDFLGFHSSIPVLTVMGGSLGAKSINDAVREALPELLSRFQIVHLCGKGHLDPSLDHHTGYKQFEYVHDELSDILAATNYVVTRGGSNAIFEFLALKKPMLIIPLSRAQSRGDQILNANSFEKKGYSLTLEEEDLSKETILNQLIKLKENEHTFKQKMINSQETDAISMILTEMNAHISS